MPAGIVLWACIKDGRSASYLVKLGNEQLVNAFDNFNLNIRTSGSQLFCEKRIASFSQQQYCREKLINASKMLKFSKYQRKTQKEINGFVICAKVLYMCLIKKRKRTKNPNHKLNKKVKTKYWVTAPVLNEVAIHGENAKW